MKVLIVDDSMFVRRIITKHLVESISDVEIIQCDNGASALEEYSNNSIDFIVTDLLMPVMTGQEFIAKVDDLNKPYNCIVCTADIQDGTRKELEHFEIIKIIEKPLTADKLSFVAKIIKERVNG